MYDPSVCRGCLATGVKLEKASDVYQRIFEQLTDMRISGNDMYPNKFCAECKMQLKKATLFRRKCNRAYFVLKQILKAKSVITKEDVEKVNRKKHNLVSQCKNWCDRNIAYYEVTEHSEIQKKKCSLTTDDIPILINSITSDTTDLDLEREETIEEDNTFENVQEETQNVVENDAISLNIDLNDVFADLKDEESKSSDDESDGNIPTELEVKRNLPTPFTMGRKKCLNKTMISLRDLFFQVSHNAVCDVLNCHEVKMATKDEQIINVKKRMETERFKAAKYKCSVCVNIFNSIYELRAHIGNHVPAKTASFCEMCTLDFGNLMKLKLHKSTVHWHVYTCRACKLNSYTFAEALSHTKSCDLRDGRLLGYICNICGADLHRSVSLAEHMIKVHYVPPRVFHCWCGYVCLSWRKAAEHQMEVHGYLIIRQMFGKFQCATCQVYFSSQKYLDRHNLLMSHYPPRDIPNSCGVCMEVFDNELMVASHYCCLNYLYEYIPKKCEECSMWLMSMKHYEMHAPNHDPHKRILCEICGLALDHQAALKAHYKAHDDSVQCPQCGKKLTCYTVLLRHLMRAHRMVRHRCGMCIQQFAFKRTAVKHIKRHRDYKTHVDLFIKKQLESDKDNRNEKKRKVESKRMRNVKSWLSVSVFPNIINVMYAPKSFDMETIIMKSVISLFTYDGKFIKTVPDNEKMQYFEFDDEVRPPTPVLRQRNRSQQEKHAKKSSSDDIKNTKRIHEKQNVVVVRKRKSATVENVNVANSNVVLANSNVIVANSNAVLANKTSVVVTRKRANLKTVSANASPVLANRTTILSKGKIVLANSNADLSNETPVFINSNVVLANNLISESDFCENSASEVAQDATDASSSDVDGKIDSINSDIMTEGEAIQVQADSILIGEDGCSYVCLNNVMYKIEDQQNPVSEI